MRTLSFAAAVAVVGAAALWHAPVSVGGETHDVGKMFAARCASCHVVPDPALRTDQAWLDQVHRTS